MPQVRTLVKDYERDVRAELEERWAKWPKDLSQHEIYDALGALLARQVTLALQLASAPPIWNGNVAPIILRSMVDTHIQIAWIFEDPFERSRKFIYFGLGQEKLQLEHYKAFLKEQGEKADDHPMVKARENWINSQRYSFLTEVNTGSWSEISTRKMAEEANCLDLYNFVYTPFSAATHSMWHHVERYNSKECQNPLHRFHKVPFVPEMGSELNDIDYVYQAAKYVNKAFKLFDSKTGVQIEAESAFKSLATSMNELFEELSKDGE